MCTHSNHFLKLGECHSYDEKENSMCVDIFLNAHVWFLLFLMVQWCTLLEFRTNFPLSHCKNYSVINTPNLLHTHNFYHIGVSIEQIWCVYHTAVFTVQCSSFRTIIGMWLLVHCSLTHLCYVYTYATYY